MPKFRNDWEALVEWCYQMKDQSCTKDASPVGTDNLEGCWEVWYETLAAAEQQTAAAVDYAVRALASKEPLPPLSTTAKAFLDLRLEFGIGLAHALAGGENSAPVIVPNTPVALSGLPQKAEWVLIDCWRAFGNEFWMGPGYWEYDWWEWNCTLRQKQSPDGKWN